MTAHDATSTAPPRGTRPRNRRALIAATAAGLFYRRGYDQISMNDLAESVAIGPSALYRHFSGKQGLLYEVIQNELVPIRELLDQLDLRDRATALPRLAALALDQRQLGTLWQREARHLAGDKLALIRDEIRAIGRLLTRQVRAVRPDLGARSAELLGWAIVSVLTSNSFHRLDLDRPHHEQLLAELVGTALDTPLPATLTEEPAPVGRVPHSRREALLAQAVRMFAEHGYAGVGINDIGAAVGMAGPSIYNHFPTKLDLLTTVFERGTAALLMDLSAVHAAATDTTDALRRLVRSYTRFALQHHHLVGLMYTELEHLPEERRHAVRRAQHDYISEWVHLLLELEPRVSPVSARIRVQAVLAVANDAARTSRLRFSEVDTAVVQLCTRLLLGSAPR